MKKIKGRLLYLNGKKGLLLKKLAFYTVDMESGAMNYIASLSVGGAKKIIGRCSLANRLLRMEPRCAGKLDNDRYVVGVLGKLWLVDVQKRTLSILKELRPGYSLVSFCEKDGCLYWGDYGANPNHEEINIYRLNQNQKVSIVYTFQKGSIRHIHSIINNGDSFVVMAGDNELQAGIYRVNGDWTEVKPWKTGEQKYRAVVGFPYKGGLLYATDSVETENHLRYIESDGSERVLASINGSCIYGGETKNSFLFSTTVEPHEGGGVRKMLSNKLGGGIKSKDVHILAVDKADLNVRIIKKYRKDIWPMKLFQYGRAPFAGGQTESIKGVWCYPIACVGTHGKSEYLELAYE